MSREYVTMAEIAEKRNFKVLTKKTDLAKVKLYHRNINRPQFFLAGFRDYFDNERLQLFGMAEHQYLKQFSRDERIRRVEDLFKTGIPGLILCRGLEPEEEFIELAEKYGVPILFTQEQTAAIMIDISGWINQQLAPTTSIYGVFVEVYGEGMLITGETGVGKSETALELVKRGHRLVADDIVEISRVGENALFGRSPALTQHFIELRGIGVVDVKSLYGIESVKDEAPIDMLINLEEWDKSKNYDRLGLNEEYEDILGVSIVKHTVPIRTGRNLAIILETAAVNNRQKKMGYNAAQVLVDRIEESVRTRKTVKNEDQN